GRVGRGIDGPAGRIGLNDPRCGLFGPFDRPGQNKRAEQDGAIEKPFGVELLTKTHEGRPGAQWIARQQRSRPAIGSLAQPAASTRPSTTAWEPACAPTGCIGWAASPIRVTRPKLQRGIGSRSTFGSCSTCWAGVAANRPCTSSHGKVQPWYWSTQACLSAAV